ncbi:MAG: family 20 glycosylhydrolase [Candidatus Latescibacterota bacterium]
MPRLALSFVPDARDGACRVERTREGARVHYAAPAMAVRTVGALLADLVPEGGALEERSPFTLFGIMLDCSRNAVMRVDHLERWLRRLALLGYNAVLLYTEDTYELPGEEYFGYLRGAYTPDEIRRIDAYARREGIEVIPCIQALGHLEQILKWPAYDTVRDTASVLLVGAEETYALIAKMLDLWSGSCGTRRIHIGMDETHDLGRGRFLDLFGHEGGFAIFNRHLARVKALCDERGLRPMIWSDMYFRLGSRTGDYYDRDSVIPPDVVEKIPPGVQLVYWDYYHPDESFYLDWIERHRLLGSEPVMGSGVWTWGKFWHDRFLTEANAGACLQACRQAGLREVFFALWGDDGAYCDFDSAFGGLGWAAEKAYAGTVDAARLAGRFQAVFAADYRAVELACGLNRILEPAPVLWDDPLLAQYLQHVRARDPEALSRARAEYESLAAALDPHAAQEGAGCIAHARLVCRVLSRKVDLAERLFQAYTSDEGDGLRAVRQEIPGMRQALRELADSLRAVWLAHNKPFGLEVLQIRLGGLRARYEELEQRLQEYLEEKVESIAELEANLQQPPAGELGRREYHHLATSSCIL